MSSFRLLFVVSSVAVALLFTLALPPATAASTGFKTVPVPPPIDRRILIKAVDVKASTITVKYMRSAKAPDHTYAIDAMTVLTVNDVKGTIDQVKVGMQVRSYVERDDLSLDSVAIGIADPAPVIPKK
jgi:hypothetical protein